MELPELKETIDDTKVDIVYYENERRRLEVKLLPKASKIDSVSVQGGIHDREKVLLEYGIEIRIDSTEDDEEPNYKINK